ncbi:MAG: metallopeptidase family protein [Dehalococcoidales bacterium]|nr:metallopeptidase family protein [Dehalococcoidales bacterium]
MTNEEFTEAVAAAIGTLPEELRDRMENVSIIVQDFPDKGQKARAGLKPHMTLLGLYEGIPLTKRTSNYGMTPPDKISIFQKPIEMKCRQSGIDIVAEIARVVKHEIAHHFGISDARLDELGM